MTDIITLPPLPSSVNAGKLTDWGSSGLDMRPCPVCDNDDPMHFVRRPDKMDVSCCHVCGMMYLAQVPSSAKLEEFYSDYGSFKGFSSRGLSSFRCFRDVSTNPYIKILESTGGIKGKSLMDVGCAYGYFLQLARFAKANVSGVELDIHAQKYLSSLNIPVFNQPPKDLKFDIISAFHLVEHLLNPIEFIESMSNRLVKDGRLLLALPNGGEVNDFGPTWVGFRVDFEHVNYFSVSTLSRLLYKCGLILEQVWTRDQPCVVRGAEPQSLSSLVNHRLNRLFNRILGAQQAVEPHISGSYELVIIARKI
ncbi:class I SAM-dependent methyltransferase [Mariprofundus sp. EBB-1]|uniref:class I SAM-dependent methyltransferase n=1 Tax=Mariprofundus sp. EBB-1 TaxID=2650971 RepID=UPI00137AEF66|nr:class I SAM-dependent methyltransferase [Mariprofundus sp. EBB-1]